MIKISEEGEIILPCISISKGLGADRCMVNILKEMNNKPQDNEKIGLNLYNI